MAALDETISVILWCCVNKLLRACNPGLENFTYFVISDVYNKGQGEWWLTYKVVKNISNILLSWAVGWPGMVDFVEQHVCL